MSLKGKNDRQNHLTLQNPRTPRRWWHGCGVQSRGYQTQRYVALKFLTPELTRDPEAKERFIHEAQAASALDHPNICTIHEIGQTDDGQMFIAMACYEGETLKKKIERGPLKLEEAIDIAIQSSVTDNLNRMRDMVKNKKGINKHEDRLR